MGMFTIYSLPLVLGGVLLASVSVAQPNPGYEIWAADQSNTISGGGLGTRGSLIWIWDSEDVEAQLDGGPTAVPVGCDGNNGANAQPGPCDVLEVFPQDLVEYDAQGNATGNTLAASSGFGRLH